MSTISARMIAALTALFFCTVALAYIGWTTQAKQADALSEVYNDAVIPLRNLKVISDRYAVDVVDAAHKTRNGNFSTAESLKAMKAALAEIDELWGKFRSQRHAAKEMELVKIADEKLGPAHKATETLISLIEKNNLEALAQFTIKEMYPAIDPGTDAIGNLIEYQLNQAKAIQEEAAKASNSARLVLMGFAALAILVWGAAAFYTIGGVVRPLKQAIFTMDSLAKSTVGSRDLGINRLQRLADIEINGIDRKDELGDMARTLLTFKEAGIERQRLRLESEADQQARHERAIQVEMLVADFENSSMSIVSSVATTSAELEASAKMMLEVAHTASEQSDLVAAASHQTSNSVSALSSAGDELAMSIGEIGRQVEQSSRFAAEAAAKARATDATVGRLNQAGKAIVEVVDLIKSIAAQTNLLALNATIEAARAGESGKGFAVVASEVKQLAAQTSLATDVISEHVEAIQHASGESITAMREIAGMIEEINHVASSIATAVTEQSQATQGIAENVQQVAQGTSHAAESIGIVNEAAANTGAAASQVLSASVELAEQSQRMRDHVDRFLHQVRTA
ncbi:MAG: hypothetical protein CFE31_01515 [Rhizobiales bacterium PAR1]|nr:MAG: hypothetical protein CFE31_01515 [Rhizobiales bacterium PAR1]